MALTASTRLTIRGDERRPGAFGLGCAQLLEGVAEERSLNRAAKRMGMAYSKAWRVVREAEGQLGMQLLERDGARGSELTADGERVLAAYRTLQREIDELADRRLADLLG